MAKGMMKLVMPKAEPKGPIKKLDISKPSTILPGKWSSWLEAALRKRYVDTRPLWDVPRPVSKGWRPSDLGEANDRLLVAKLLGYRGEPISEKLQRIFDAGNDIEARWIKRFRDTRLYVDNDIWLPRQQSGKVKIRGKVDAIIKHPHEDIEYLVEIKSIAPEGYRMLPRVSSSTKNNFDNLMGIKGGVGERVRKYMAQLQVYLFTMDMTSGILLFDDKGHQDFKDYEIDLDREFVDDLFNRLKYLQDEFWSKRVLPPWNGGEPKTKFGKLRTDDSVALDEFREEMSE